MNHDFIEREDIMGQKSSVRFHPRTCIDSEKITPSKPRELVVHIKKHTHEHNIKAQAVVV